MKSLSIAFCLLILVLSGCGASPDSLVKEQIQLLDELVTAMENDAPQAEIEEIQERTQASTKKLEALDLSTAEKEELANRYKDKMAPLAARLQQAMMKKAMNSLGKGMKDFPGFPKNGLPGFGGN